ncbi:MAG: hypothetical protein FJ090_15450, partial [Deltaproteobacteria bacterium]|nr:hypothetical protein [Deltaproteobacteria bacterium]
MSRKTPPTDPNQGFGDLDEWFNEAPAAGFEEPDPAEQPSVAEAQKADAKKAKERKAEEARAAEAKKAEEARQAEEAKKAEKKRKLEEAKQREEDARQAQLEADARRAARAMQDEATRVYKRKSKAEILAEEDAADSRVEPSRGEEPAAEGAKSSPEPSAAAVDAAPVPVSDTAPLPDRDAPTVGVSEAEAAGGALPTGMSMMPLLSNEDAVETEVVDVPAVTTPRDEATLEQTAAAAHLVWTPPADERAAWADVVDTIAASAAATEGEPAALLYGA